MKDSEKEFGPSSWAIENKTSIYVITIIICLAGLFCYNTIPKEQFPQIKFPQIIISTVYPGTSPKDIESLVTKQIEKQVKSITGVKKVTSQSLQDFSSIIVEFYPNVQIPVAKQDVKDAVDKAKTDLPTDLPQAPIVTDIDISEQPIVNINLSGDLSEDQLKTYSKLIKDRIEEIAEVRRVDVVGALEKEVQINVDPAKMNANNISFQDIQNAIDGENLTISGGEIRSNGSRRVITVSGEFKDPTLMRNLIIKSATGATVYLGDIATVVNGFADKASFATLDGKHTVSLNLIKRSGENIINTIDKTKAALADMQKTELPKELKITLTADQSVKTRASLHDLINTIILGFIFVTLILMFFMGVTNAFFVAVSVPVSCFIAFMVFKVFPGIDITLNFIVLFSFILALGIVVDDAIVVIENTHRIFDNGKVPIKKAAKIAAGEVFLPVLSGTLVTLAPFFPLLFWNSIVGKFMVYLPLTLIITLLASLVVAYIINPVFAVDFMKPEHSDDVEKSKKLDRPFYITTGVLLLIALIFYINKSPGVGNFFVLAYILFCFYKFILIGVIRSFQQKYWPKVQNSFARLLNWFLVGYRPAMVLISTFLLLIAVIFFAYAAKLKVEFFPTGQPNYIYTYIKLPIGTDQKYTDSLTGIVEKRIRTVIGDHNPLVESVLTNVALGASADPFGGANAQPQLGKVTVAFVEFGKRNGKSSRDYLDKFRKAVAGIPGAQITVDQESNGPPTGKPISIEISGDDIDQIKDVSEQFKQYILKQGIQGIEELKSDTELDKPDMAILIDREKAQRLGLSTASIGFAIRNTVFGNEMRTRYRDGDDDVKIYVRYKSDQRNDPETLMNQFITFRSANGQVRSIPISAVASYSFGTTYGGINRKDQKRTIKLESGVLTGFNANEISQQIVKSIPGFSKPAGVTIRLGGEQQDQAEAAGFLAGAFGTALALMFIILVSLFNSVSKPVLIMIQIIFSLIGVIFGFALFGMTISVVMTGIGLFSLAGIIIRNGILLVEFADMIRNQGTPLKEAIIESGRTRMTPVLLTASSAILGLIPLAVGLNIDFGTLFTELNPHIYFGGDNVVFFGPLSWTMIFGLIFGTFLTLVLVPNIYYLTETWKLKIKARQARRLGIEADTNKELVEA